MQIVEGPNLGLGAGSWRLWVHHDDIYLAGAQLADTVKVSLHSSGRWRVAYTAEHVNQERPLWTGPDRAAWKFASTPFVDGVQEAFVIAAARASCKASTPDPRETIVPIADRWDRICGVRVVVTEPEVVVAPDRLVFPTPLRLSNGRLVWLLAFEQHVPATEPEPVPAAQVIRVMTPETDDVSCPGYLLIGANLS